MCVCVCVCGSRFVRLLLSEQCLGTRETIEQEVWSASALLGEDPHVYRVDVCVCVCVCERERETVCVGLYLKGEWGRRGALKCKRRAQFKARIVLYIIIFNNES